jgi:3-hydroxybutyryl-CoA dehydrogenase
MVRTPEIIGVIGAGAMGAGIAQVAARAGHTVYLSDTRAGAAEKAVASMLQSLKKLEEKGKLPGGKAAEITARIHPVETMQAEFELDWVIEAVVEDMTVKQQVFSGLESVVKEDAVLATNTSSLSVTAIASACRFPQRVVGLHFFNPAPLMPLVEVVPALQTDALLPERCMQLMSSWGKVPVLAKDTPGFIVNRLARPYYGESLRIFEEGIADFPTIDWALKTVGGFRMGPFELMDLIGNDVNYTVTETVWTQFYFDPRYRPSLIQKQMRDARRFGRKSGRGYYDYSEGAVQPAAAENLELGRSITERVVAMLINEAVEALYLKIADRDALDLAMTNGVNYPKGLLRWADDWGLEKVLQQLEALQAAYGDDRYRPSVLLRKMAADKRNFY